MPNEPDVRYVVPENISEEQVADARRALEDLARSLGRLSARACHELGIQFDMDDPEVAREVMKMTVEAAFLSPPPKTRRKRKGC